MESEDEDFDLEDSVDEDEDSIDEDEDEELDMDADYEDRFLTKIIRKIRRHTYGRSGARNCTFENELKCSKKTHKKHAFHYHHHTHCYCKRIPIRHLTCGKMPRALCNTAKHMKCMANQTCRIEYQAKLCRKDRSCNAKFKVDLEKLKHFKGYYKKVRCGKRRGKAQKICYWHSLCHAFHYKDPIHVKVMCKGFITYMHSPWAAGFMKG